MGEHEKVAEDRPYTHSEIQKLLDHSSVRNRAMILLMSSAGLRGTEEGLGPSDKALTTDDDDVIHHNRASLGILQNV
jgi:hypothetical protein